MKESKIKSLERLLPEKRYAYTLESILEHQFVWFLEKEENALAISQFEDKTVVSLWSSEELAKQAVSHNWADFRPKGVGLGELEPWLEVFEDKNWLLDVFPVGGKTGTLVTVEEFIQDLNKIANQNIDAKD